MCLNMKLHRVAVLSGNLYILYTGLHKDEQANNQKSPSGSCLLEQHCHNYFTPCILYWNRHTLSLHPHVQHTDKRTLRADRPIVWLADSFILDDWSWLVVQWFYTFSKLTLIDDWWWVGDDFDNWKRKCNVSVSKEFIHLYDHPDLHSCLCDPIVKTIFLYDCVCLVLNYCRFSKVETSNVLPFPPNMNSLGRVHWRGP